MNTMQFTQLTETSDYQWRKGIMVEKYELSDGNESLDITIITECRKRVKEGDAELQESLEWDTIEEQLVCLTLDEFSILRTLVWQLVDLSNLGGVIHRVSKE